MQLAENLWAITIDPARARGVARQAARRRRPLRLLARSHAFQYFVAAAPGRQGADHDRQGVGARAALALGRPQPHLRPRGRRRARLRPRARDADHAAHVRRDRPRRADPAPGRQGRATCSATRSGPRYVAVALPEEMPVVETLELERRLPEAVGVGLDAIVVNGVWPERFSAADAKALRAASRNGARPSGAAAPAGRAGRARAREAPALAPAAAEEGDRAPACVTAAVPVRVRARPARVRAARGRAGGGAVTRPRGGLRNTLALLAPTGAVAGRVALERDAGLRLERLRAAARARRRPARRMRSLRLSPGARLRWEEVPAPGPPGPGEAVVHPIAIATCDLDRPILLGATPFPLPLHFGHECVAEVLPVGPRCVTVARPASAWWSRSRSAAGRCAACRSGSHRQLPGGAAALHVRLRGRRRALGRRGRRRAGRAVRRRRCWCRCPRASTRRPRPAWPTTSRDGYRHLGPHLPALLERDPDAERAPRRRAQRGAPDHGASVSLYAGPDRPRARAPRSVTLRGCPAARARPGGARSASRRSPRARRAGCPPRRSWWTPASSRAGLQARARGHVAPDGVCTLLSGRCTARRKIPTALMYGAQRDAARGPRRTRAR